MSLQTEGDLALYLIALNTEVRLTFTVITLIRVDGLL